MRNYVVLFFFEIFVVALAIPPRDVGLVLETVFLIEENDVDFIVKLQKVLRDIKQELAKSNVKKPPLVRLLNDETKAGHKQFKLTDFIFNTLSVLRSYEDEDLKKFFNTLDTEIKLSRKEFSFMRDKLGLRRFINRNVELMKNLPAQEIRRKLKSLSETLAINKRNGNDGVTANLLNYFYKNESKGELLNFFNNLKIYRSKGGLVAVDLNRIIRSGIMAFMEPFLKINSDSSYIKTAIDKHDANNSDARQIENKVDEQISITRKPGDLKYRHKSKSFKGSKENEILDYIEDHIKLIDEHITKSDLAKKRKLMPFKNADNMYRYPTTKTKKSRKIRVELDIGKLLHGDGGKIEKYTTDVKEAKPVLIKLASTEILEERSKEQYVPSTPKRKTKRNMHRKKTRPKVTNRNFQLSKTTKSRKAFRTTTESSEGLSIEHFGSLFGEEYHRKSNYDDIFVQPDLNTTVPKIANETVTKYALSASSKEVKVDKHINKVNEAHIVDHGEINNYSRSTNLNIKINGEENNNTMTKNIKIQGKIVKGEPAELIRARLNETTTATSKPVEVFTERKYYNVSIVTRYANFKPTKATAILNGPDLKESNKDDVPTLKISTASRISHNILSHTTRSLHNTTNYNRIDTQLENEIEGIMDKFNASTAPIKMENFVNNVQSKGEENEIIKN